MKISAIKDHEESSSHDDSQKLCMTTAGRALKKMKESERQKITHLVRNAHYIAKQNKPLSDYVSLTKLNLTSETHMSMGKLAFISSSVLPIRRDKKS